MFIESFSAQETVPFLKYVQSFRVTRVTPFFATLGVYRVTIPRAAEISSSKQYD